jgi:DNA-binding transcriptional MerR regulator
MPLILTPYRGTAPSLVDMETLTIGRLAHEAGVNIETIRYYERRGLIRQPPRTSSGYRQYSAADLWRLQFISRAKQLGFTLAEIATLVGPDDTASAHSVLAMARAKIRVLDDHLLELAATRTRLDRLIDVCADPDSEDCRALRVRP